MCQKHSVRPICTRPTALPTVFLLTSPCRNPVFFPSDRNTFFFFGVSAPASTLTSSPSVTISFWDYDSVGAREEIGQVNMSFDRLLLSGERCPSDIISLPIVIHKPKTSPIRGYVDLRYGLVSVAPPLPAAELLSRAPVHPHPFSHYLQRRIRFLQVTTSHRASSPCFIYLFCLLTLIPTPCFLRNTTPRHSFQFMRMRGQLLSAIHTRPACRAW